VIVDAVPFACPGRAGGRRNARDELRQAGQQAAQDRRLADPRRARNDDDVARAGLVGANHRSVVHHVGGD
jgi:hypothetical protein